MNNKAYQDWAITKDRPTYQDVVERLLTDDAGRLIHAAMGISGEAGELIDAVKKHIMYGKALDVDNIKEELGDSLWYMALMLDLIGSSFEEVMALNHDKLEKRFPGGFTEKLAQERLDKKV